MTREEIKKIFPDATDEQITSILNSTNAEKEAAKKSADKGISDDELTVLKAKAKAYDDAEKEKMTAEERYKKLLEEAEQAKAEATRVRARTKAEAEFIKAGLTETEYKDLLDDVVADDDEKTIAKVTRIANLIKSKTDAAVKTTTENLMKTSSQPQSKDDGKGGDEGSETDAAVSLAKELAGSNQAGDKSPFDYYK